jgi:hypothetical protein
MTGRVEVWPLNSAKYRLGLMEPNSDMTILWTD